MTQAARDILVDGDAPTLAVLKAALILLGEDAVAWEPDTFRLEFAELGLDVPEENYDAIFACIAVSVAGTVFWDTLAFAHTVLVLNDQPAVPSTIPQALPEQLAWAVPLMVTLASPPPELDIDMLFDTGPQTYMAACCVDAGMVLAPQGLEFIQEEMNRLGRSSEKTRAKVMEHWQALSSKSAEALLQHDFDERGLGVQLARLTTCRVYALLQKEAQQAAMARLT